MLAKGQLSSMVIILNLDNGLSGFGHFLFDKFLHGMSSVKD